MSVTASIFISVPSMPLQLATSSQVTLVVSGLLVEFVPLALNVGSIDLLYPILRFDFFHLYRNGLFSVMQNVHNVFSDCFSETLLLQFGFAGPQLDDHMRHCSLLTFQAPRNAHLVVRKELLLA